MGGVVTATTMAFAIGASAIAVEPGVATADPARTAPRTGDDRNGQDQRKNPLNERRDDAKFRALANAPITKDVDALLKHLNKVSRLA